MKRLILFAACLAVCSLTLWGQVTITPPTLPNAIQGTTYSQTLTGTSEYGAAANYTFTVAAGNLPPGTTLSAAGALGGTLTGAGTFNFTIQCVASGPINGEPVPPLTGTQAFTVVVYPTLVISPSAPSPGTVGVAYSQTFTATGGAGPSTYTWSLSTAPPPPGLSLSSTGVLSGTPTTAGTYTFSVLAFSQIPAVGTAQASQSFTVVIAPPGTLTIIAALGAGTVGVPFSATLGATGGYGPGTYTYSLASGTPPAGITLSAAGTLSGTPTTAGTSTFTVQVTSTFTGVGANFPPLTATQSFTLVIYTGLAINQQSANSGTVSVAYSQTFTATGGAGPSTYTWSLAGGTLPPGLTLSAAGLLSGTPTTAGTFSFTVQVSSLVPAVGVQTASQGFTVVIAALPPLTITGSLGAATINVPYSATLGATGGYGNGAYGFALASGTLPPGITLSTSGTLSGTPTAAGTFTFVIQVTSTLTSAAASLPPLTATQSFTLVVSTPPLTITGSLGGGTVNVPYSTTLGASGGYGAGTYTFSLASGTLPLGIAISAGGTVSGTPTGVGTFTFTVQVSSVQTSATASVQPLTATQSFTVVISAPSLTITGTLGNATVGVPYLATLGATGGYGTGSYTFSVVSGALPLDMALSAGGILSGTPTAAGTSTFAVQVTSTQTGQPLTATQSFTLTVGIAPVPPIAISGLPATPPPATQLGLVVSTTSTYPIALQGTITLTFTPDSGPDDPNVQFTTGGRTASFQIPAGSTLAQFPGGVPSVQTGTVAGTITLTLTSLTAAGADVTPTPPPTQVLVVAKSAPVITSATVTATTGGFNLVVVGYSTTRDMVSAAITFTPVSGVTLTSNTTSVSLSQVFTTWYQSSTAAPFGSMFSLEIPFTIQNGTNPLASVSVALTNSQGTSVVATAPY